MEHPFLNTDEIATKSLEEIQEAISSLSSKLNFAYRNLNGPMINQLNMALDSYRTAYSSKMDEVVKKQGIQTKISIQKDRE
jgi:hypothetical protein